MTLSSKTFRYTPTRPRLIAGALLLLGSAGGAFFLGLSNPSPANAQTSGSASDGAQTGPPPAPVELARAVEARLAPLAQTPGTVISTHDSLIAAVAAGKVDWVADVGAAVVKGDVIAKLDPADARLSRDEARANVKRLKARADYEVSLVKRFEDLGEESGEPEASLDQMRATRDQALQEVESARVALRRAEAILERMTVRAPFAGRVAAREIDVGEFATIGAAVVRLVDTQNIEVSVQAPSSLLASLSPGASVQVAHQDDLLNGNVRAIVPVGDTVTRMLEVRLGLPNARDGETRWPIGAPVRVSLPAARPRLAVAAPRDALVLRAGRISVYKINDENIAERVDVETGAAEGDLIEVIGDVKAGDNLVIRGGERLRDGQKVIEKAKAYSVAVG